MAIKSKTQLQTDISTSTFTAPQQVILDDMVDSYEDYFPQINTAARNALTPTLSQVIFNTDVNGLEIWDGITWKPLNTSITVEVNVTAGQMAALNSVQKVIKSAVGAGFTFMPIGVMYRYTAGATPYDFTDFLDMFFDTQASTNAMCSIPATQLLSVNTSGYLYVNNSVGDNLLENKDLVLKARTANPTTGNGTLTLWVGYQIVAY